MAGAGAAGAPARHAGHVQPGLLPAAGRPGGLVPAPGARCGINATTRCAGCCAPLRILCGCRSWSPAVLPGCELSPSLCPEALSCQKPRSGWAPVPCSPAPLYPAPCTLLPCTLLPYSPVPCSLSFVLRGLRLLPKNGRLHCIRWLSLAHLGWKAAGAALRHAGWEALAAQDAGCRIPFSSWRKWEFCAAGRSQELYYITPDGKASEAQDTVSMPALLDSLQGPQVFRRCALASHLSSSRAARPHRNSPARAVRSERTSSAQLQFGSWSGRMRQCLARVSQTLRLPHGCPWSCC